MARAVPPLARPLTPGCCPQYKTAKVVYRRYAGLFFSMCVDVTDNELAYLESIHLFVEILDHYFSNVCELDLVFNFHKACSPSAGVPVPKRRGGRIPFLCSSAGFRWRLPWTTQLHSWGGWLPCRGRGSTPGRACGRHLQQLSALSPQVYLILDEFIMGGELQETSKKVWAAPRPTLRRVWGPLRGCTAAGHPHPFGRAGQDRDLREGIGLHGVLASLGCLLRSRGLGSRNACLPPTNDQSGGPDSHSDCKAAAAAAHFARQASVCAA